MAESKAILNLRREWRVFMLLVLTLLTVALFSFFPRFSFVGDPLLITKSFEGWKQSKKGVSFEGDLKKIAIIKNKNVTDRNYIATKRPIKKGVKFLRLSGKIKAEEIYTHSFFSGGAGLFLIQETGERQYLLYYPKTVVVKKSSPKWRNVSLVFPVDKKTRSTLVGAGFYKSTGILGAQNITLEAVVERGYFSVMKNVLIFSWVITLFLLLGGLLQNINIMQMVAVSIGCLIMVGALMPVGAMSIVKKQVDDVTHKNIEKTVTKTSVKPSIEQYDWIIAHKWGHFAFFASCAFFSMLGWKEGARLRKVSYLVGFGMILEVLQLFVDGRSPHIVDVGVNTAGVMVGIFTFLFLTMAYQRHRNYPS